MRGNPREVTVFKPNLGIQCVLSAIGTGSHTATQVQWEGKHRYENQPELEILAPFLGGCQAHVAALKTDKNLNYNTNLNAQLYVM